jgi:hypothetical protein
MELIASGPKAFCEGVLGDWIANHPLGEFDKGLILEVSPLTEAEAQAEYQEYLDMGLSPAEAAGSVLWPPSYDGAAVERGARVLIEDGRFGVPWEDASEADHAETMNRVWAILAAVMEGK